MTAATFRIDSPCSMLRVLMRAGLCEFAVSSPCSRSLSSADVLLRDRKLRLRPHIQPSARRSSRSSLFDQPQRHHAWRRIPWARMLEVRQIEAAGRLALLRTAPRPARDSRRKTNREGAEADFRTEFRSQSGEARSLAPRTDAAGDPHDEEGLVGEAIPIVHGRDRSPLVLGVKLSSVATFPHGFSAQLAARRK
jgi:hypothetical protein